MRELIRSLNRLWDRFLFESCDPRVVPVIRIGFALLMIMQTSVAWIDAEYWFADTGVLRAETAVQVVGPTRWSLLFLLPSTSAVVQVSLLALMIHAILLLLGIWSRVQVAAIFVWLVSFQNRNPFIHDGEDVVFRIFAFLMIWLPLDAYWSVLRRRSPESNPDRASVWALRLIQLEMAAIYASAALSKLEGVTWQNGTAAWFVSTMNDNFGRLIPGVLFDHFWFSAAVTWGTIFVEAVLPIALWFRSTRKYAILAGVGLHLGIEVSMNLFLFQWLMLVGLVAFIVPDEWSRKRTPEESTT